MERILFVLPLEERFTCSVHGGILKVPVKNASGRTVCKECAQKEAGGLSAFVVDESLQDDINGLLCYCKYGVMIGSAGELVADPKGCDHIVKYGNRGLHEATCEFRDADFVMVDNSNLNEPQAPVVAPPAPRVLLPCANKEDGCFFLAESDEELALHLNNECSYERLRRKLRDSESRVQLLEREIQLRDEEIEELRNRVTEESNRAAGFASRALDGGKEVWEELAKVLEELPQGRISALTEHLLESNAFQKSSSALSSLKSNVVRQTGKVKQGLADMHPLEKLQENVPLDRLSEMHPLERLIALLSSLKNGIAGAVHARDSTTTTTTSSTEASKPAPFDSALFASQESVTPGGGDLGRSDGMNIDDEDVKKQIAASLASYEEEQKIRMEVEAREAAAVAAAAAMSLQNE